MEYVNHIMSCVQQIYKVETIPLSKTYLSIDTKLKYLKISKLIKFICLVSSRHVSIILDGNRKELLDFFFSLANIEPETVKIIQHGIECAGKKICIFSTSDAKLKLNALVELRKLQHQTKTVNLLKEFLF